MASGSAASGPAATENEPVLATDRMTILKTLIGLSQTIHSIKDSNAAAAGSGPPGAAGPPAAAALAAAAAPPRNSPSILPPPQLDDEVGHGLTMSRAEYVSRQNKVFEDLTGFKSPKAAALAADSEDTYLVKMLEVYMSSLDARIYKEMSLQNRLHDVTEDAAADVLSQLLQIDDNYERYSRLLKTMREFRDEFAALQHRTNTMIHQRCQLESQRTFLKQRYAAELSRRVRLDHTVRVMSKKLVELNDRAERAEDGQRQAARALKQLQVRTDALELQVSALDHDSDGKIAAELAKETTDMASLDAKLRLLWREIHRLQKLESMKEIPDSPEKILPRILVYVDNARGRKSQHVKDLIKAFLNLFETREQQLLDALARCQLENEIYLARCDRLSKKCEEQVDDMRDLLDRTVDLVLTDKQLRETLSLKREGIEVRDNVLKRTFEFFQFIKTELPDYFSGDKARFLEELEVFVQNSSTIGNFEQSHFVPEESDVLSRLKILEKLKGVDLKDIKLQIPNQDPIPLADLFAFGGHDSAK